MPKVEISTKNGAAQFGEQLTGVDRCPHCAIASPLLARVWGSIGFMPHTNPSQPDRMWGAYTCRSCGSVVIARGAINDGLNYQGVRIDALFPSAAQAHQDLPPVARQFLQQAYDTLHAPDAAAVMAGSAVDAMLKAKGYDHGSLYSRIDLALADNLLTQAMADWAHSVRLGSNRPRHADEQRPHVLAEEAKQSVEFSEALGNFLFVLTARVERGIIAAQEANKAGT